MDIIGIIGLVCIAAAWIAPTLRTVRQGSSDLPLSFLLLTVVGNLSLTIYSVAVSDLVYFSLNGLALAQGSVNLLYKLSPRAAP